MARILLGLSFNAESVKAVAIDINSGNMIGRAVDDYQIGVIRNKLPTGERIPNGFMLGDPKSWLVSMARAVEKLLDETGIPSSEILSVGVSMGSCVVLPADSSGVPLCLKDEFKSNPHSWPKLWNHKSSFKQAKKMTKIARDRGEPFLDHTGNRISSEWLWPKLLETIDDAPEVAKATEWYIEGSDWIVWQLTGKHVRNQCSAGYKACYVEGFGYPSGSYFEAVSFDLARQAAKIKDIPIMKPGRFVGNLLPEAAQKLGLMPGTPVGAGVASNHVGVAGAGIYTPDTLTIVFGDSTAQMLMSVEERIFEGYSCAVKDGIIDGFWGYEAGQPGTGEIISWFIDTLAPYSLYERSHEDEVDISVTLDRWLSEIPPGSNGVLSLEWFDGNKSVLYNPSLTGCISGLRLTSSPAEIYKSLIEASALGSRKIVESFKSGGLSFDKICAVGSIPFESPTALQIYADVLNMQISVPDTPEAIARGTAIIGAMSLDLQSLGYTNREDFLKKMKPSEHDFFKPTSSNVNIYEQLFSKYCSMHDKMSG